MLLLQIEWLPYVKFTCIYKQRKLAIKVFPKSQLPSQALSATLNDTVAPGTYNLVRQTFSVLDIVEALKEIQPELEFIFINQHLALRELRVEQDQSLNALLNLPEVQSLKEDLSAFEQRFSF